ncbi:glycosyltransferase [Ideonella livida]|uniref:Glycosyltransferase n=1 Tax=Ideonella livida TaxID=2707176 RepID=A0A7C9PJ74_9BURK|nr:glycosyltransferase [Ideonella livida]NDY92350.1 glycosyltransferase [Ideonella livida]
MNRPVVFHVVAGSFTGSTQVAAQLVRGGLEAGLYQPVLVLSVKPGDDPSRWQALQAQGLTVETVPARSRWATVRAVRRLCLRHRPQVLVAHGFPEHLYARCAGWWAGVPVLMHVEHNSRERYSRWRRALARWLAGRTAWSIGVSEGVRQQLLAMGLAPGRTVTIGNGIDLTRFGAAAGRPLAERQPGLVMAARLVPQKDHATLLQALHLLRRDHGLAPPTWLVGQGTPERLQALRAEVQALGLQDQVQVPGHHDDVPALMAGLRVGVLSTHYEGMPLTLLEAMAAGMAVVGSAVPGVQELLRDGVDGLLVPPRDPAALAAALHRLLTEEALAQRLATAARQRACAEFSWTRTQAEYDRLILQSLARPPAGG